MSTLETNSIAKYSGNNVAIDDSLNLKSYTTTQRDALTSAAGDIIYNSTDSKVQVYTGSAWQDLGGPNAFNMEYVIIAGGGAGGASYAAANGGPGGGAGGYVSNVAGENTGGGVTADNREIFIEKGIAYPISVGAGATGQLTTYMGSPSYFGTILAVGGGSGFDLNTFRTMPKDGGSAAGGMYTNSDNSNASRQPGTAIATQGYGGGRGGYDSNINYGPSGGGGGAGAEGGAAGTSGNANNDGGDGGAGVASSITGSSVTRAGGGGGGCRSDTGTRQPGAGGSGGGGAGGVNTGGNGVSGTANTGGGGGGNSGDDASYVGGSGGSGIVILRYLTADVSSYSQSGLTITASTTGSYSVLQITAGTGTITFS